MASPQRSLRYPYNKVQGPPTIVGWTMVVSTTPAWGMELTTSSLGAVSPNHQAKAVVPQRNPTPKHNIIPLHRPSSFNSKHLEKLPKRTLLLQLTPRFK